MTEVYGYADVGMHAMMLVDGVRMRAFGEAIKRTVTKDDVVVDVGAGSGILSLLCAKAGARKVFAVERGAMASLIVEAAKENGFADIITVIRDDARTAPLSEPPTLIVSEMIGSFGVDEDYVGLIGDVKKRCAPGCRVLPSSIDVVLGLAEIPDIARELAMVDGGFGVKLGALRGCLLQRPSPVHLDPKTLLTPTIAPTRFTAGGTRPTSVDGDVTVTRAGNANAIVSWFTSILCDGVTLSSAPEETSTHWAQIVFPFDPPVAVQPGDVVNLEVRPRLITDRGTYSWRVKSASEVRYGDAMQSLVGSKEDMLEQLGITLRP
ncbi:MAG TPA: 50S ribosomal protein L11 methyltransferase [Myxococcota bacterium]|jgi:hypothetical protein